MKKACLSYVVSQRDLMQGSLLPTHLTKNIHITKLNNVTKHTSRLEVLRVMTWYACVYEYKLPYFHNYPVLNGACFVTFECCDGDMMTTVAVMTLLTTNLHTSFTALWIAVFLRIISSLVHSRLPRFLHRN